MPRLTRRSLASKEDDKETTPAKGKRGAKKEPESIGEGSTPSKTTKSARGKATPAPRATGRGRGKKEEEPEEEEEVEETVEEESPAPKRGRGGRAKKEEPKSKKATPAPKRGRGRKEAEPEEEEEEDDEDEEEIAPPAKKQARGGRGGKKEAAAAPKRNARGGRGKKQEEESEDEDEEEEESPPTPKGRQGRGGRASKPTPTPPASGSRRSGGRGKRGEGDGSTVEAVATTTTSSRSRRGGAAAAKMEEESAEAEEASTEVESESVGDDAKMKEVDGETGEKGKSAEEGSSNVEAESAQKEEMEVDSKDNAEAESESGKKRKHGEDDDAEEESSSKKMRVEDDAKEKEISEDYVVINKEDLPAADSKEVKDCLPPVVEVKKDESDVTASTLPSDVTAPVMAAPSGVPLTEAELAKQYNPTIRDRDDNSSMMVEVGSEAASDVGSVSRNLDVSEVTGMDVTAQDDDLDAKSIPETVSIQPTPPNNTSAPAPSSQTTENSSSIPPQKSPVVHTTTPDVQLNSTPAMDSVATTNNAPPQSSPVSQPTAQTPLPPPTAIPPPPSQNAATQNGNCQSNDQVSKSVPLFTSTPAKKPLDSSYVPSSPSITKRKVISNSKFPIELMDPAFWFSVVSYNILADCHLRRYNYSYTESQYLDLSYRHSLFMKEFDYLDSDVVCLQEVDTKYYHDVLLPAMTSRGYHGVFKKRTQDWYDEGEATFVKTSKFEVLGHQGISLKDLANGEIDAAGLTGDVARAARKYVDRADVVLLCSLKSKKTGKFLTVANIHVAFDPKAPDIQCIQIASAVKELVTKAGSDLNPYIICGDFNSETTSPAYQLAKDGYLSDEHIRQLLNIQSMDNTEGDSHSIIKYLWKAFQHTSSNMKSAYEACVGKEPNVTSLNGLVRACLDYIFFSSSTLHSVNVLEALDPQVVDATGGLPSQRIPSDHLSMKAVFRLKDD